MKRIVVAFVVLLGLHQAADALDIFRIVKTSLAIPISSTLTASSPFGSHQSVARVVCSATCWLAVHASNAEDVTHSAPASMYLINDTPLYIAVPASFYIIVRRDTVNGKLTVTEVEPVQ